MENIISRTDFNQTRDAVDCVSGTVTVIRCTEDDASRMFPSDPYLEYLRWLDEYFRDEAAFQEIVSPSQLFEHRVREVELLLEPDGSLYVEDYRTFLKDRFQIMTAINFHLGMSWISDHHIETAIKRRRQRHHE